MRVALVNPPWTFENSIYFGCRAPHLPLELGYSKALLEAAGHEALMLDAGIVRNRAKIEGTIAGARAFLAIQEREGFGRFLWGFVDGRPVQNALRSRAEAPAETEVSRRISKALKAEGFAFCGPTIVYAFMQAVGMVNDHLVGCFRHADCAVLAEGPNPSGQGASGSACA